MTAKGLKKKNLKWWIGIISCVALFSVIIIFGYKKMFFVFDGVKIKASIAKTSSDSSLFEVKGNAKGAVYLSLNGREIFIDKGGNFSESVAALPGFSVLSIDARDKFGKKDEKQFELVSEGNAKAIAFKGGEIIN